MVNTVSLIELGCCFELRFYVPLDTKYVISETFFPANVLASTEETKNNILNANIDPEHKNTATHKHTHKNDVRLVASYDLRPETEQALLYRPYCTAPA